MLRKTGITHSIVSFAIDIARQGNNVFILSSNPTNVFNILNWQLTNSESYPTNNCKVGWIDVAIDSIDILYRKHLDSNAVIILDNYCKNITSEQIKELEQNFTVVFYDEIMNKEI